MPGTFEQAPAAMKKRRLYWAKGNPQFDAREIESGAGRRVVRRNHPLQARRGKSCQGWDRWTGDKYLAAIGTRSPAELAALWRAHLKSAARASCCGKHREVTAPQVRTSRPNWGGRRERAGRPCKSEVRRVDLATTVDQRTLELIDGHRGDASRGEYLDRLVRAAHN